MLRVSGSGIFVSFKMSKSELFSLEQDEEMNNLFITQESIFENFQNQEIISAMEVENNQFIGVDMTDF